LISGNVTRFDSNSLNPPADVIMFLIMFDTHAAS